MNDIAPSASSTPPYRGTFVVDSSVLIDLIKRIPNLLKEQGCNFTYEAEVLGCLADQGFRIKIPEMVALEVAGLLHIDGKNYCIENYFDGTPPHGKNRWHDRHLEAYHMLCKLMAGHPNIELVPPTPYKDGITRLHERHVNDMKRAVARYELKSDRCTHEKNTLCATIRDLQSYLHNDECNLGDDAIVAYLSDPEHGNDPKIVLLASDGDFAQRGIRADVSRLDFLGLWHVMNETGVAKSLGFSQLCSRVFAYIHGVDEHETKLIKHKARHLANLFRETPAYQELLAIGGDNAISIISREEANGLVLEEVPAPKPTSPASRTMAAILSQHTKQSEWTNENLGLTWEDGISGVPGNKPHR